MTGFFEMAELYEKVRPEVNVNDTDYQYMKNYPFSDARVKRERDQNPTFRLFLNDRTTAELTQNRDVVSGPIPFNAENSLSSYRDQ